MPMWRIIIMFADDATVAIAIDSRHDMIENLGFEVNGID